MKKSKMFMATGALVLAVTAIFATKANKKFSTVTSAQAGSSLAPYIVKGGTTLLMTTAQVNGGQLNLAIDGTSIGGMYTDVNDSHKVHLQ